MKISLAWVFDYIEYPFSKVDIDNIIHLFNTKTAEIEQYEKVVCDFKNIYLAQVKKVSSKEVVLYCKELGLDICIPTRQDAIVGKYYFIIKNKKSYSWIAFADFDSEKEGLFPAVEVTSKLTSGSWRQSIEQKDYILDVDNKSINHRPDLWGHYGIAREIAAFLNVKLKPLQKVLQDQKVVQFAKKSKKSSKHSVEVDIQDSSSCSRFAGLFCSGVIHKDSDLAMSMRLLRVGAKPINQIVDLTNYVMFDVGHPMHVFDAQSFKDKKLVVRKAKKSEKLTLLDDQALSLRQSDLVVASTQKPVALAGIMGGKDSGFSDKTQDIFLEAAGFDATTLRKTAQHFKLRTEASIRFEKQLDPMQNITVLQRFLYLAHQAKVLQPVKESIVSVGQVIKPKTCIVSHNFIEKKVGGSIEQKFIQNVLKQLGFEVSMKKVKSDVKYTIMIPTYRATKDIEIQEDIVEEIVRMYGFENITYQLPSRLTEPFSTHKVQVVSQVKRYLAFACRMHEVQDYLFYDESFINRLGFKPSNTVTVKNSVSENWIQLVDSLVPHLLKNVEMNNAQCDHMRFFEWNVIWSRAAKKYQESSSLAGIVFDKKSVDFYAMKQELQGLWDLLGMNVVYKKPTKNLAPWYDPDKTAQVFIENKSVGFVGMIHQEFIRSVVSGQACVFEFDGTLLSEYQKQEKTFVAWSKYQDVSYDISLFVPLKVSADQIKETILKAASSISSVELVDFYEKEEWPDKRSLTFRYQMSSKTKTFEKKEIENIAQSVIKAVKKYDAQIR